MHRFGYLGPYANIQIFISFEWRAYSVQCSKRTIVPSLYSKVEHTGMIAIGIVISLSSNNCECLTCRCIVKARNVSGLKIITQKIWTLPNRIR